MTVDFLDGKDMYAIVTARTAEHVDIAIQTHFVAPFDPEHWLLAFGIGILPLVAMELWKAAMGGLREEPLSASKKGDTT